MNIALQLIAATLFGFLAIAFIVPLAAAGKILIHELYVKDHLGGAWPQEAVEDGPAWIHRLFEHFIQRPL